MQLAFVEKHQRDRPVFNAMRRRQKVTSAIYGRRRSDPGNGAFDPKNAGVGAGSGDSQLTTFDQFGGTREQKFPETNLADFGAGIG